VVEPLAVVVDDDAQQLGETVASLNRLGFSVSTFEAVGPAREALSAVGSEVDLFVLDRKLPMQRGETAVDELGDLLFWEVSASHPDSRIIVFSGYTDFDHLQEVTAKSGSLEFGFGDRLDRVSVYKKQQTDLFDRAVAELSSAIKQINRIAVMSDPRPCSLQVRALRRVAAHYGGTSIRAEVLSGGLTQAVVWRCSIADAEHVLASVIVKVSASAPTPNGIQELLPHSLVASRLATVRGAMFGSVASVLQIAGPEPVSLFDVLKESNGSSLPVIEQLRLGMDSALPAGERRDVRLVDLLPPVIQPDRLQSVLEGLGVPTPDLDLWVPTTFRMSHLDFHGGNVLVCDGAPVVIDSEDSGFASSVVDPLVMLMSSWIHPDSAYFGGPWPAEDATTEEFCGDTFVSGSPDPAFYGELVDWIQDRTTSPREFWGLVLAYGTRQTTFPNVQKSPLSLRRLTNLVRFAAERLAD